MGGEVIRRVLIANRGEIALRVIRACHTASIDTVAVYSDADAAAPHVHAARTAVRIGPAPAAESYLNVGALIDAARQTGADAVHPGYGFLSERAHFARAVEEAGLIFIGPTSGAIARLGSKTGARTLMEAAGVPVVPGAASEDQSDAALIAAATALGVPLLVKPASGGGGIGMKTVRHLDELATALPQARREAQSAFGNPTLYLERLVECPRHIEVQVFADAHGHTVHLFERECSAQRRHQKVIEETPSPAVTPAVRARIGAAAVTAAEAVGYRNAGTVEFLLEGDGDQAKFYFLEINTRLQVEHPITECVVGVDLVRAQIAVASGEELPWRQGDLAQRGHALECRIYAEDPAQGFLPQAGPLLRYREPSGPGIRVDSGVIEGGTVSVYYDPMLAKLITWGETRTESVARALEALSRFEILGVRTNIAFLMAILRHQDFVAGRIDTGFLRRELGTLTAALAELPPALAAAAAWHASRGAARPAGAGPAALSQSDPFETLRGWRG
ncbi:MAG: acetyl-CoA carboxylase biotin carboxylase subunit [Acidobacteria bacterium]|nr:acetyl-CoA carboxylase biotin carboxylase subunit [Acidobacteriota bacterium]